MDGILLVDKPSGPTSFDIIRTVRKRANQRKVGHAGTLDPLASGLLAVCLGQGTKLVPYLMAGEKRYEFRVALGEETDTLDSQGAVVETARVPAIDEPAVREVLDGFLGTISQIPPEYSAIKQNGEALYKKARRGEAVAPRPRAVEIYAMDLKTIAPRELTLEVRCAKGTYVRSLARDIARALGTVGHITSLRRTAASGFTIADACPLETLTDDRIDVSSLLLPLEKGIPHLTQITVDEAAERAVRCGQPVEPPMDTAIAEDETVALITSRGSLLCIAVHKAGVVHPRRVFPEETAGAE